MNILLIDSAPPSFPFSGKTVRLKNIYGRLAKDNKIYLLTASSRSPDEDAAKEIEKWARKTFSGIKALNELSCPALLDRLKTAVRFKPWFDLESKFPKRVDGIKSALRTIVAEWRIELVITLDNEVAQYGAFLSGVIPWIQDIGDSMILQTKRQMRLAGNWEKRFKLAWRLMRETRFEKDMADKANATIFVARDDAGLYEGQNGKIRVIPNGVDTDYFNPAIVEPFKVSQPYVVFTGHMSFRPNQDAAAYFAKSIFPLLKVKMPEIKFVIAGADPAEEVLELGEDPNILVTGKVSDIRPYLAGALAFVCPMRMGSGIKNKILEALAMELPVIATPLAVKGIDHVPSDAVAIASGKDEFMSELTRVLENRLLRKGMGVLGRKFVLENYSWGKTISQYENLFASLAGRSVSA
ncbi:MAG: glycosyltransferase [Candidatus Omnitrophica bacterium]|nr:glycosyltransferase [Candidatus Omnitrophota bacterium]